MRGHGRPKLRKTWRGHGNAARRRGEAKILRSMATALGCSFKRAEVRQCKAARPGEGNDQRSAATRSRARAMQRSATQEHGRCGARLAMRGKGEARQNAVAQGHCAAGQSGARERQCKARQREGTAPPGKAVQGIARAKHDQAAFGAGEGRARRSTAAGEGEA